MCKVVLRKQLVNLLLFFTLKVVIRHALCTAAMFLHMCHRQARQQRL